MDVGVLEEDAGGDLLFKAGAGEEVVVDAVDLPRSRRARGAGDHATDGLRAGPGETGTERGLAAAGGTRDDDEERATHARWNTW